ncbi:hypothetical protein QEV68_10625 [Trueperella pyogenes]|uniref:hypothetical protein n=1 Tax=Trueperella pyogenes TaxID=1661 RepID=UPI003248CACE
MNQIITTLQEELDYHISRCEEIITGEGYTAPRRTKAKATLDAYHTIKDRLEELIEENNA